MIIQKVGAKKIKDSRGDFTIEISVQTDFGKFSSSAPNGKSKGKYEAKSYKNNLEGDIEKIKELSEYFSTDVLEKFDDLRRIEDVVKGHVGANTLFALESCALKAMAKEQKKEIWEIINPNSKKIPRLVGNCIGGGLHSTTDGTKPDFQEFLLIPPVGAKAGFELNKKIKKELEFLIKKKDKKFSSKKNDEDAWITSLGDKEVLEILSSFKIDFGIDIASSSFHKRKKYYYSNPKLERTADEQLFYLLNLLRNFNIRYIEDPFEEEDFKAFASLLEKFPDRLIVGDDLTVTNSKRLQKAIDMKSINALIVKPNQCGSLMEVKRVVELAKANKIKMIFSHRSGETSENILADLAVGFEADFIKCGITGPEREAKIKRLIEIEKNIKD